MKTRIARIWTEQLLSGSAARSSVSRPSAPLLRNFFTSTQHSARSRLPNRSLEQSALLYVRFQRSALARRFRSLRFKSDKPNPQYHDPTPHLGSPEPAPSLSQRLKQLSREYGWAALGVYLGLSLIDFPFCFLAVRLLGVDRIGHYEDVVKGAFWIVVQLAFPEAGKKSAEAAAAAADDDTAEATLREGNLGADEAAVRANKAANACMRQSPLPRQTLADTSGSNLDSARSGLPRSQIPDFLPSTTHCSCSPEGRQDFKKLGLQYWKEEAQTSLTLGQFATLSSPIGPKHYTEHLISLSYDLLRSKVYVSHA